MIEPSTSSVPYPPGSPRASGRASPKPSSTIWRTSSMSRSRSPRSSNAICRTSACRCTVRSRSDLQIADLPGAGRIDEILFRRGAVRVGPGHERHHPVPRPRTAARPWPDANVRPWPVPGRWPLASRGPAVPPPRPRARRRWRRGARRSRRRPAHDALGPLVPTRDGAIRGQRDDRIVNRTVDDELGQVEGVVIEPDWIGEFRSTPSGSDAACWVMENRQSEGLSCSYRITTPA